MQGEDLSHDNIIDKSELTSLTIGRDNIGGDVAICDNWPGTLIHYCRLNQFVFAPDTPLGPTLGTTASWADEGDFHSSTMTITKGGHHRYDACRQ